MSWRDCTVTAREAEDERCAAERVDDLFGFLREVLCGTCAGYRLPEEVHCQRCNNHHQLGDDRRCRFIVQCRVEEKARARRWNRRIQFRPPRRS